MAKVSFVDNCYEMNYYYSIRDYSELYEQIVRNKDELTHYLKRDNQLCGYTISKNEALTKIYGYRFFVIRLTLADFDTLHKSEQVMMLEELFNYLNEELEENVGYYNFRVPTHIVDVIKAYNIVFKDAIFCGGTVEEMISNHKVEINNDEVNVFFASKDYINQHKYELKEMTYKSFKNYQGQYHISPLTSDKAGDIYENWIDDSFSCLNENSIIIAQFNGKAIGYVTIGEGKWAVEGILSAVDKKYRSCGAYRKMIGFGINYAYERNKNFITSTQFDNFVVQGIWNSMGMKPYYSIYNFHINKTNWNN